MANEDIATLQRIGWLFREINVHFREEIEAELARRKVGMTFSQVSVLSILSVNPGINGAQLARRNMVSPQAMTGVLRQLSADGLLVRSAHPESLRADSWHLTRKGEKSLLRGREAFAEVTARMLSALGKADVGKLEGYLQGCSRSLIQG
jgi:DNA-binding MarR family transcriptional regulator